MTAMVHDVGKYLARTARNLGPGPVPRPVAEMLARDLYALADQERASAVFERLAAGLEPSPLLVEVRALLSEIDRLEPAVRAAEDAALRRAAGLAIEVERRLRSGA